jgi:uncharacterized protein YyaL (SSP411 family)
MIAALAKAAQALGEPALARAAARSADFILEKMRDPSGRLYRRFREGHLANPGYLEDYAYLVWGLIELYEATFDLKFLQEAISLTRIAIDLFWDEEQGGFFFTARDGEALIAREKEIYDGAVPSGNSVGLLNLLRLGKINGEADWSEKADLLLRGFSATISSFPMGYTQMLNALDWLVGPSQEIVIAGDPDHPVSREMVRLVREAFLPNKVLLFKPTGTEGEALNRLASFAESLVPAPDRPTAYVCEQYACRQPVREAEALRSLLSSGA